MVTSRSAVTAFTLATMLLGTGAASGQAYPNKVIRLIAAAEAGSGTDLTARVIAPALGARLGQQIIIDNRVSLIAAEAAAKAPADGYTLLMSGPFTWLAPYMRDNVAWDPVKDFAPLTLIARTPSVLAVHPSLPVKSVKELIALARARPGELNCASGAQGGPIQISGELFKAMTKVNVVLAPYKGAASAIIGLIGGEVQMMFASPTSVVQHVKAGRMRLLAVTSAEPSELAPGLPTVAAAGVPGYVSEIKYAMFAPAKTSPAIINRLNEEMVRVLHSPDMKAKLISNGVGVVGSSPEELTAAIKAEMATVGKVLKDAGVHGH